MHPIIKLLPICSILFGISFTTFPKDVIKYPVSAIPAELITNASMVVRNDVTVIKLVSPSKFTEQKTFVITVLKESAIKNSILNVAYGKYNRITKVEANVYDANGNFVKRIKNDDILDLSAISGESIYSDNRRKYIDPKYRIVPFTIEYEVVQTVNSAFFLPSWTVFAGYNTSVEKSTCTIEFPETYQLRFKENKLTNQRVDSLFEGHRIHRWEEKNFKAQNPVLFAPIEENLFPSVMIAPSTFEIDNYSGNMQSWQEFGKFIGELNEPANNLPEKTVEEIREMVKDCKDDYEKVKLLYEFAQRKNRYVSIQVGIGGWQSIDAESVDRLSYGDCKALSVYTRSLLNSAGLKANLVLIGAGDDPPPVMPDFPVNFFNHMILCVPIKNDTIWLECTSPSIPMGYLGDFTDDRWALQIEGDRSSLKRTPSFKSEDNVINTSGEVILYENGNALGTFVQKYSGEHYGNQLRLKMFDEKDRRDAIIQKIKMPNFDLVKYSFQEEKSFTPSLELKLDLNLYNYATIMGNRMIVKLQNPTSSIEKAPRFERNREYNIEIRRSQVVNDSIVFQIPDGYSIEALPAPVSFTCDFGYIQSTAILQEKRIQLVRKIEFYKGIKSPEKYGQFTGFMDQIGTLNNSKFVLNKVK